MRGDGPAQPGGRPRRAFLLRAALAGRGGAELASFWPIPVDAPSVAAAARRTLLVCSDGDPYCPEGADAVYGAPLGIETEVIPGGGHLNTDAGRGPWPAVERWCRGAPGPLGGRPGRHSGATA